MHRSIGVILICVIFGCQQKPLPILGHRHEEAGKTIYTSTPEFSLRDQYGHLYTRDSLNGKCHLSSFFFTSCPTICPKVMRSMMSLEAAFHDRQELNYVCFSIDFRRDSVARLAAYYHKLGIENPRFRLLSGTTKESTHSLAANYMSIALEDNSAPGGFDHSGYILLVDPQFHIRSYCLGTDPEDVERFKKDIALLLQEAK